MNFLAPGSGFLVGMGKAMAAQLAGNLIENHGKVDKAFKGLASKHALRDFAASVVTAGIGNFSISLPTLGPLDGISRQLQNNLLKGAIGGAIHKQDLGKAKNEYSDESDQRF